MYKVKFYLLACVFFTLAFNTNAQKYYYFQSKKVNITIDSTLLIPVIQENLNIQDTGTTISLSGLFTGIHYVVLITDNSPADSKQLIVIP